MLCNSSFICFICSVCVMYDIFEENLLGVKVRKFVSSIHRYQCDVVIDEVMGVSAALTELWFPWRSHAYHWACDSPPWQRAMMNHWFSLVHKSRTIIGVAFHLIKVLIWRFSDGRKWRKRLSILLFFWQQMCYFYFVVYIVLEKTHFIDVHSCTVMDRNPTKPMTCKSIC